MQEFENYRFNTSVRMMNGNETTRRMKLFSIQPILILIVCWFSSVSSYSQHLDLDILKAINPQHPSSTFWIQTSASAY